MRTAIYGAAVLVAAAFATPLWAQSSADERLGERACAAVVPALGSHPRLDDLCSFLLDRQLAKAKLPERFIVLDELPTNAGGKVDKALLRDIV